MNKAVSKTDKIVKFVYWKLGKPGRLATPAAIRDAKVAAQEILNSGYSIVQIMEMFTFMADEPEVNGRGFDEGMSWWRSQINDLPSLAVVLAKSSPNKFVMQYEKKSAEMRQLFKKKGYSMQHWVNDMTDPDWDDPTYGDTMFAKYLKNPERFIDPTDPRSPAIKKMLRESIEYRDELWRALVQDEEGDTAPLLSLVRKELTEEGLAAVFVEGQSKEQHRKNASAISVSRLAEAEKVIPHKYHLQPQTDAEKRVYGLVRFCFELDEMRNGKPDMTSDEAMAALHEKYGNTRGGRDASRQEASDGPFSGP